MLMFGVTTLDWLDGGLKETLEEVLDGASFPGDDFAEDVVGANAGFELLTLLAAKL